MIIDFNDPASLAEWLRGDPQRSWPLLLAICRVQPRWRDNAFKAREIVKAGEPTAMMAPDHDTLTA